MRHASPPVQDDRSRLVRRRVLAAVLVIVVIALFVGGTVVALNVAAHQLSPGAAAASAGSAAGDLPDAAKTPDPSPVASAAPISAPVSAAPPASAAPVSTGFDRSALSIDDPNSLWVVVNKLRPLSDASDFVPPNLVDIPADLRNPWGHSLRSDTIDALESMAAADHSETGTTLVAQSGYRSYASQTRGYNSYVSSLGQAGADATSARPGYSEHQTGLAVDILDTTSGCDLDSPCFGSSPSGTWLAANAYRFGFILRYPADKTAVTGYQYEPWHFRYVGVSLATEMHTQNVETLEEFFDLPPAPDYAG